MKNHFYLFSLLLLLHTKTECMNQTNALLNNQVVLLTLHNDVLQKEILAKAIVPNRLRFIDVVTAFKTFKGVNLTCKTLERLCNQIDVKHPYDNAKKLDIVDYLKFLQRMMKGKNSLRWFFNPKHSPKHLPVPQEGQRYPKISLYLYHYIRYEDYRILFANQNAHNKYKNELTGLLEKFHNVNNRDTAGCTPLYYAVSVGECPADIVQLLIEYGATLDNIDGKYSNAMQIAQLIEPYERPFINIDVSREKKQKIELLAQYYVVPEVKKTETSCSIQ